MNEFVVRQVGTVRSSRTAPVFGGWQTLEAQVHILPEFTEGLDGIEGYSHVVVVYWLDRVGTFKLKLVPQGNPAVPTVGIFACRCPARPTPIAMTTCRLERREGNVLYVRGLDALDGTPVLDVKPYWPQYDRVEEAWQPAWVQQLEF